MTLALTLAYPTVVLSPPEPSAREREHTLEEIGQEFDVTRERIRQIEAKALRQLRAPERARRLRALMAAR